METETGKCARSIIEQNVGVSARWICCWSMDVRDIWWSIFVYWLLHFYGFFWKSV